MSAKVFDEKTMTEYLLGLLSDKQREQMEASFFQDDAQFDQLSAFEDDLIDSYVRGRLPTRFRKAFEKKLQADSRWKQRVTFAQALARRVESRQSPANQPVVDESATNQLPRQAQTTSFWQSVVNSFRLQRPLFQWSAVACSVLFVAAVSLVGWQLQQQRQDLQALQAERNNLRDTMQSMETELAELRNQGANLSGELDRERVLRQELEAQQQTPTNPLGLIASFILRSGTVRATSDSLRFAIPSAARSVRLQLDLDVIDEYQNYRTEIRTARGDVVWSRDALRPLRTDAGQAVIVEMPAQFLNPGEYEIALSGLNNGRREEVAFYYFSVSQR